MSTEQEKLRLLLLKLINLKAVNIFDMDIDIAM